MATESPIRMLEGVDKWPPLKHSTRFGPSSSEITIEDLGLLIKDQRFQSLGKDVMPSRCESAPPSIEGSKEAFENIFSQRKSALNPSLCHTDLASSSYHDSDVTSGKKFAGPLDSRVIYRLFQHSCSSDSDGKMAPKVKSMNGCGEFSNIHPVHEEGSEDDGSCEQSACLSSDKSALMGYHSGALGTTQESSHVASSPTYDRCHSSNKSTEERVVSDTYSLSLSISSANDLSSDDTSKALQDDVTERIVVRSTVQRAELNAVNVDEQDNISSPGAHIEAGKSVNFTTASNSDSNKFHKKDQLTPQNNMHMQYIGSQVRNSSQVQGFYSQVIYPGIINSYGSPSQFYPNLQSPGFFSPQYSTGVYSFNSAVYPSYQHVLPYQGAVPLAFGGTSFPASGVSNGGNLHTYDMQNLKFYSQVGEPMQHSSSDLFHLQFLQLPIKNIYGTYGHFSNQAPGDGALLNHVDSGDIKKGADLIGSSNDHISQHSARAGYNSSNLQRGNMSSQHSFGRPVVPAKSVGGTNFPGGRYTMSHSHSSGDPCKIYALRTERWNDANLYSFLEELKSDKGQRFELSDITGHISEFSVDQHGSRFIQQKLQTCSVEEKALVFKEVVPNALKLTTDVFGNYVIQKLFDFGSPDQRKDLANKLEGQVLPLSLQMYGCRVIQKAVDVCDLEQKTRLVRELDGHVIRCVRDQNGNHVIQKCIERIPVDKIHFLISSFHGQVAALSMHPYGCRVIQRILEHCKDALQTQFIFDEILDSICSLAQDQYGNYVTQHVLERGEPQERSKIIEKLSGSIVQLSQHKFASNVIEKCLEYGDSTSRGRLIEVIIGHGDNNDNLLIMMKDQYANYVIQKIIQKCTSDQREVLLGLIKNHLTALKKYTYGKHIIARFERLYDEDAGHPSES